MVESDNSDLLETTVREKSEFETLRAILLRKREAIEKLDTDAIRNAVAEELEGLNRIKSAEAERASVLRRLELSGVDLNNTQALLQKLSLFGESYAKVHSDFRSIFREVQNLNGMINTLLIHSIAFIRQNIRILTDNGNRKLVDKKA